MDEETITIPEAMRILGRSEKSIREYIKAGRLNAEIGKDRKLHILKSDVERLAKKPAQIQVDKMTLQIEKLNRELTEVKARLEMVEKQLEEATRIPVVQTPTSTPQPRRTQPQRQQTDVVTSTAGSVPEGHVILPAFLHGVPDSTAKRYINQGFTVTEGTWKVGNHRVTRILSPEQQREYYEYWHNDPRFMPCPGCPHEGL